jgi:hypothetical protein
MNANEHETINHLDDMIQSSPAPQPGINADDFDLQSKPTIERNSKGELVIMMNGEVVGTMMKSKKMSYADGLKAKFDAKRLAKINAFKATK